jgi:hypothetical protein
VAKYFSFLSGGLSSSSLVKFFQGDTVELTINQTFYKAHGTNASWEWLEKIAPCVEILRNLARNFNDILGADVGKRHAPPNLTNDIETLTDSLEEYGVYKIQKDRVLGDGNQQVPDVVAVGLKNLTDPDGKKSPLSEYNDTFQRLQRSRRMDPIHLSNGSRNSTEVTASESESAQITSKSLPSNPINNSDQIPSELMTETIRANASDNFDILALQVEEPDDSELTQILDDLEHGVHDPTLPRWTVDYVAFEMDNVLVSDNEESDSSSDSESDNQSDSGLVESDFEDDSEAEN